MKETFGGNQSINFENDGMSLAKQNHCRPALEKHGVVFRAPFKIRVTNFKRKKNAADDEIFSEILAAAA